MKGLIIIAKFQRVLNNNDFILYHNEDRERGRKRGKNVGREKLLKVDAK